MIEFTLGQAFLNPIDYIKNVEKSTFGINHPWLIDLTKRIVAATSGTFESGYRCAQFGVRTFKALLMDRSEFLINWKKFCELVVLTLLQPVGGFIAPERMVKYHEDLGLFPVADEKKTPPPPPQPPFVDPKIQKEGEEEELSKNEKDDPNKLLKTSVSTENVSLEAADKAKERSLGAIVTTVALIGVCILGFVAEQQIGCRVQPEFEIILVSIAIYWIITRGAKKRSSGGSETKLKLVDVQHIVSGLFVSGFCLSFCERGISAIRNAERMAEKTKKIEEAIWILERMLGEKNKQIVLAFWNLDRMVEIIKIIAQSKCQTFLSNCGCKEEEKSLGTVR